VGGGRWAAAAVQQWRSYASQPTHPTPACYQAPTRVLADGLRRGAGHKHSGPAPGWGSASSSSSSSSNSLAARRRPGRSALQLQRRSARAGPAAAGVDRRQQPLCADAPPAVAQQPGRAARVQQHSRQRVHLRRWWQGRTSAVQAMTLRPAAPCDLDTSYREWSTMRSGLPRRRRRASTSTSMAGDP
jgi:hypothetical protein